MEARLSAATLIEIDDAPPAVRAVYDDIMRTRQIDWVNNFWKAVAVHPPTLERTWTDLKAVMAPGGALDPVVKEMIYLAVSVTNGCGYCVASHSAGARKAGMTDAMFGELMAIVGMANATNRLAVGFQVPIDDRFKPGKKTKKAKKGKSGKL
jgi:AhpD family alkylhydroperoxidase